MAVLEEELDGQQAGHLQQMYYWALLDIIGGYWMLLHNTGNYWILMDIVGHHQTIIHIYGH